MSRALLAIVLILVAAATGRSQPYSDAVKQLAARIASEIPPKTTVAPFLENRSSLAAADLESIRGALDQQLRTAGLEIGESDLKLRLTVSENASEFLIISEINGTVFIAGWKRPAPAAAQYTISVHVAPIWQQRTPVLDLTLFNNGMNMVVLEPERTAEYTRNGDDWHLDRATPLTLTRPTARDPRGRLIGSPPAVDASMPSRGEPGPADVPYRWVPGRNYFESADRGNFFTSAQLSSGTLLAGTDGRTRWFPAQKNESALTINDWGSDIAPIASACGSKTQVLATAPVVDGAPDRLQAFEFTGAAFAAVTEPVLLAGPVTALWPAESPDQVTMVVQDRQTGMYEASRVTLACAK